MGLTIKGLYKRGDRGQWEELSGQDERADRVRGQLEINTDDNGKKEYTFNIPRNAKNVKVEVCINANDYQLEEQHSNLALLIIQK